MTLTPEDVLKCKRNKWIADNKHVYDFLTSIAPNCKIAGDMLKCLKIHGELGNIDTATAKHMRTKFLIERLS